MLRNKRKVALILLVVVGLAALALIIVHRRVSSLNQLMRQPTLDRLPPIDSSEFANLTKLQWQAKAQNHIDVSEFANLTKLRWQAKVQNHLKTVCNAKANTTFKDLTKWQQDWVLKHLIVDDRFHLLYCYVPKVGCANWKRVFSTLYGEVSNPSEIKSVNHSSMRLLASYSPTQREYRLETYFKFMFVRHPLARLLSAYRNKFTEHFADFERKYGIYIVKTFRADPPEQPKGDDVRFSEFLAYITATSNYKLNEHWSPFVDLCQPCSITYDYIGYYEQFDEDIDFLLQSLSLDKIVRFPQRQSYYKSLSEEERNGMLEQVPSEVLRKLNSKLQMDYRLFGYAPDSFDVPKL